MKSCGVIVEYNPFHNGHAYHVAKARAVSQAEVVVAVMSGNFLQRGEPALIDKWQRTESALQNGVDLVIEFPFAYAVQSADYFAKGAVKLLQSLGVEALSFGTDQQASLDYQQFAEFNQSHQVEINQAFHQLKNNGMSYPQQMTAVYRQLYPEWALDFNSPNHILGMSYAKANQGYSQPMKLFPIQREMTSHHDQEIAGTEFASGTAIRQAALEEQFTKIQQVVPQETYKQLQEQSYVSWEEAWPLLKYQVMIRSIEELQKIYQMVEGIEYRLKEMVYKATSFAEFISLVKTKRFTWTRLQRLCTYLLLNIDDAQIEQVWQSPYLRVLGFNQQGQAFLKEQKKSIQIPIITNINQQHQLDLAVDLKAGQLYQELAKEKLPQDYYRQPIRRL